MICTEPEILSHPSVDLFLHRIGSLPPLLSTAVTSDPEGVLILFKVLTFSLQTEVLIRGLLLVCSYSLSKKPFGKYDFLLKENK